MDVEEDEADLSRGEICHPAAGLALSGLRSPSHLPTVSDCANLLHRTFFHCPQINKSLPPSRPHLQLHVRRLLLRHDSVRAQALQVRGAREEHHLVADHLSQENAGGVL